MGTVCGPIFVLLYVIIVCFFTFFFCQDADKAGSNCAIIGYTLSKKHNLALYETKIGELNYVDHKFFFNILLGPTCAKTWGQIHKYYRTG